MASLLSSSYKYDSNFIEGTVTSVDPIRFVCSVKTIKGQFLNNITWLLPTGGTGVTGVHFSPSLGDKVLISTSLSYPLILGCIPRLGLPSTSNSISGNDIPVDAGNSTHMVNGYTANPDKPKDFVPGDFAITTESGGLFAVLSSGGMLLKASQLAQIFLSPFGDLVRIVGRNFIRFSDASSRASINAKGKLYEWFGVDWDLLHNRTNTERYNEAYGHVAAGESLRGEPESLVSVPARDSRIRKYWLKNAGGTDVMIETLFEDGKMTILVDNIGNTLVTHDNSKWESSVTNGTNSKITILPGSVVVDHGGVSTATFDASHVNIKHNASTINITDADIKLDSSGHFCYIDSSGVHLG